MSFKVVKDFVSIFTMDKEILKAIKSIIRLAKENGKTSYVSFSFQDDRHLYFFDALTVTWDETRKELVIKGVGVKKEYQRQGYFRSFMEALKSCESIYKVTVCSIQNPIVSETLSKLGYKRIHEREYSFQLQRGKEAL